MEKQIISENIKDIHINDCFKLKKNHTVISEVKKIVDVFLKKDLQKLEKMFSGSFKLSFIEVTRNYHTENEKESFSNYFHTDGYSLLMQKIFINLSDVDQNSGPLEILNKPLNKQVCKKIIKNNGRLKIVGDDKMIAPKIFFQNIGKKGSILLCDTTNVI